jgi:hypothetical protein
MNQITRHKLLTLAFGCLLLLTMLFAGTCAAQTIQYQIERVCINQKCKDHKGYIVITTENLYIKVDSILTHLLIRREFKYLNRESYKLKDHTGRFYRCNETAYLEIYSPGCGWYSEMYYLKKEL